MVSSKTNDSLTASTKSSGSQYNECLLLKGIPPLKGMASTKWHIIKRMISTQSNSFQ